MRKNKLLIAALAGMLAVSPAGCGSYAQAAGKEGGLPVQATGKAMEPMAAATEEVAAGEAMAAEGSIIPGMMPGPAGPPETQPDQTAEEKTAEGEPPQGIAAASVPAQDSPNQQENQAEQAQPEEPPIQEPAPEEPAAANPPAPEPEEPEPPKPNPSMIMNSTWKPSARSSLPWGKGWGFATSQWMTAGQSRRRTPPGQRRSQLPNPSRGQTWSGNSKTTCSLCRGSSPPTAGMRLHFSRFMPSRLAAAATGSTSCTEQNREATPSACKKAGGFFSVQGVHQGTGCFAACTRTTGRGTFFPA